MICPKCGAPWHTYTRAGLQIEQCSGCRGIFLDYGELERIVQLEGSYYNRPATPPPVGGYPPPGQAHVVHHQTHGRHPHYRHQHSFLGELFG